MEFMNFEKLVKNLTDDDFKYLIEEFGSKNLELLKLRFGEEKFPEKQCFYSSVKDETTNSNSKKLDRHIIAYVTI